VDLESFHIRILETELLLRNTLLTISISIYLNT
jgi:hypothetical protein